MTLPPRRLELDHLVVAAATLADGVAWCERVLGIVPTAGGQHRFMGTHNRVFDVSSAAFPRSYLEVIAIDRSLPAPPHRRWFDLDDATLQRRLADGPRLVHWAARCTDIARVRAAMIEAGVDGGEIVRAERAALRWQITLRADGHRPLGGAAPALIEWEAAHPTDAMVASGVQLVRMSVAAPGLAALLPAGVQHDDGAPLRIELATPRGAIELVATGG